MTAARSSTRIVRYLLQELECTVDFINAQEDGRTALHYGIGSAPKVALLLEHQADPNIRDYYGRSPQNGCTASAELLWETVLRYTSLVVEAGTPCTLQLDMAVCHLLSGFLTLERET